MVGAVDTFASAQSHESVIDIGVTAFPSLRPQRISSEAAERSRIASTRPGSTYRAVSQSIL